MIIANPAIINWAASNANLTFIYMKIFALLNAHRISLPTIPLRDANLVVRIVRLVLMTRYVQLAMINSSIIKESVGLNA